MFKPVNGVELRRIREKLGLNQADFALMTGVTRTRVSVWETRAADTPILVQRTARFLDAHPDRLGDFLPGKGGAKPVRRAVLYLDTEFNGFRREAGELISMALVCPDGRQWYAAKKLGDLARSGSMLAYDAWVGENVLPKLGTEQLPLADFQASFRAFLAGFDNPEVICDSQTDALHFCALLGREPVAFSVAVVRTPEGEPVSDNPHNALADAIALMRWHQATSRAAT
jgi:transcriptional regulator with XRE-family HTH domain